MIAKPLPRVFSSLGNMAAAGKRVFFPSAAILENEKTLGTRLLLPKLYKLFYSNSNGIPLNSVQCGRELEQLKGNENVAEFVEKNFTGKILGSGTNSFSVSTVNETRRYYSFYNYCLFLETEPLYLRRHPSNAKVETLAGQ